MKLITKAIEKKLEKYPLYSQDGKGEDADIICKFFNPYGRGTWYVLEGEKQENGDWCFYGIVELFEREYGYFYLSGIENVSIKVFGLDMGLERDTYFTNKKVRDIK